MAQKIFRIYGEVTTYCNARCFMCSWEEKYIQGGLKVSYVPDNVLSQMLDSVQKMVDRGCSMTFLPLGLGEPLLFLGLQKLFRKLKEIDPNIYIIVTTNAVPLTKKTFIALIEAGVNEFTISLNADTNEGYKKLMGMDKYEVALKNIINAFNYKKSHCLTSPKISVQ